MDLRVEYRGSIDDEAIFLITKDNNVVVQFRVAEEFLLKKDMPFESWMNTDKIRKQMSRQNLAPRLSTLVQDLRHGMKKVNVEAEVLENPKTLTSPHTVRKQRHVDQRLDSGRNRKNQTLPLERTGKLRR
jgi:hypothetical protein